MIHAPACLGEECRLNLQAMPRKVKPDSTTPTRLRIYCGDRIAMGPGKVELLSRIASTGSISEAARQMGMSYNRAWLHIQDLNQGFKAPLVVSLRGGSAGGGAALTKTGERVLTLYQKLEAEAKAATAKTWNDIQKLLRR